MARDKNIPSWEHWTILVLGVVLAGALWTLSVRRVPIGRAAAQTVVDALTVTAARKAPAWEHPKMSRFAAPLCTHGITPFVHDLALTRAGDADQSGEAQIKELDERSDYVEDRARWSLQGRVLTVSTGRYQIDGVWSGKDLTATVSDTDGEAKETCKFHAPVASGMKIYN
jgi:hypothetical protein